MSDAIVRIPIRSAVRDRLLQRLVRGTLPSARTINLASLAAELSVSPTPLREALIELERDGFVESAQGRGFFVKPMSAREVEDLYPLIAELEVLGLRRLPLPDPQLLVRLDSTNADLDAATDPACAIELDALWHTTFLAKCPNQTLLEMLRGLKQRAARYEFAYLRESGHKLSTEQHAGIVRALRKRDFERAATLLRQNWEIGPQFLLPWLKRENANRRER